MGAVATVLPIIPLLVPAIAMAIGWVLLGDPRVGYLSHALIVSLSAIGIHLASSPIGIDTWYGLVFAFVLFSVPLVYLVSSAGFRNLDPSLEEAGRVSGRGTLVCFFKISLPSIRYSVASAALLVTIACIGIFTIPEIIAVPANIPLLSVYIYDLLNGYPPDLTGAVVIGITMILVILAFWLVQRRLFAKARTAQVGGRGVRANRILLGKGKHVARLAMLLYILLATILPLIALIFVSLQPYWSPHIVWSTLGLHNFSSMLGQSGAEGALKNSVILAAVSATITAVVAGLLAVYARQRAGLGGAVVGGITKIPAAVPNIVIAVAMLAAFGGWPFYLDGSLLLLIAAYSIALMAPASIAAEAAVGQIGTELIEASRVSGAGMGRTLRKIFLPLMSTGLVAGWVLVFVITSGDLTVAAILAGPSDPVIGFYILNIFGDGTWSQLAAMSVIVTAISTAVVSLVFLVVRPRYVSGKRRWWVSFGTWAKLLVRRRMPSLEEGLVGGGEEL
jgi:iron(III) transport system permease protein